MKNIYCHATLKPDFNSFTGFAQIIFPAGQSNPDARECISKEEAANRAKHINEMATFLYRNMAGDDFDQLVQLLNAKR